MSELETITEEIQKECHVMIELVASKTDTPNYQDITNVFLFRKIAELQIQIKNLNK